jgi:hypothetical protein
MTDGLATVTVPVIVAWGATGAVLIGAFFGGLVTVITAWKVSKIEGHVNSEKTADKAALFTKDMEIAILRERIADLKATAGLLAQAKASESGSHPVATLKGTV